jgi:CHAT domain-containing protein/Tfp pilus assembly protein PilF
MRQLFLRSALTCTLIAGLSQSAIAQDQNVLRSALKLGQQATQLYEQGEYQQALPLAEEALSLREQELGANHPLVAATLSNVATLHQALGNYDRAATLLQRALTITAQVSGIDSLDYALQLNNLAEVYRAEGNYTQAEELHLKSIAIRETRLQPTDPSLASAYNNLAEVYRAQGNVEQAKPLYEKALQIARQAYGENHSSVAVLLNNLAELYRLQGDLSQALDLYGQSLQIVRLTLSNNHPHYGALLNNVATLYLDGGQYAKAILLIEEALQIIEQQLGNQHPNYARSLDNLATAYYHKGDYAKATSLFQQTIALQERALGNTHPDLARSLKGLSYVYRATDKIEQAIDLQTRANQIEEYNLSVMLSHGNEARKQAYLLTIENSIFSTISLNIQQAPQNPRATRLALTTLLQRKGRVLDTLTDSQNNLRKYLTPDAQVLLSQLAATRSQLAALLFGGASDAPDYPQQLTDLRNQIQAQETQLSQQSAQFKTQAQPITLDAVQKLLPADSALIEFVLYRPLIRRNGDASQWGEPRYAAYILHSQDDPQVVDLGAATALNRSVTQFRNALRDRRFLKPFQQAARTLDDKLMQPLRPHLKGKTQLLISPDGQLNLVPFAALIDPQEKYALENYTLSYLSSGRDLLRLQTQPSTRRDVLLANPQFGNSRSQSSTRGLGNLEFSPLPGTDAEVKAIAPLLPNALILSDTQASEAQIKQVQSPRILHIATHGFFLNDEARGFADTARVAPSTLSGSPSQPSENPLLRSGLALAGFNQRQQQSDGDDGVLTALEASSLDLWGTQLVVLSACETGVGEVSNGEGVYGLRRAFVVAGAASQLFSLWQVDDLGTKDLMVKYYQQLLAGKGRSEALRQTQLEMLNDPRYRHPYYWAVFNLSGDWRSLQ